MKTCRDCGEEKPLDAFHKQPLNRDGRMGHCKDCAKIRARNRYEANKERERAVNREKARLRRLADPVGVAAYERAIKLRKKYGITVEDWDRMYDQQLGRCAICFCTLADVKTCVDHNHQTGEVRGLLCNTCNQGLGYFGEDLERMRRAIAYLSGATEVAGIEEVMHK